MLALTGALVWVVQDGDLINFANPSLNVWLTLLALSLVVGTGLSWSQIRRKLSGQSDLDGVDE